MRLDQRLREIHPALSWSRIRSAIERGHVTVDGAVERDAACEVVASRRVDYDPARKSLPFARIDLPRLYEDDTIMVVDKPAGLLTVPSQTVSPRSEDTVLRRAQDYSRHLHGRRSYAGVLHRLDRDTSGALAIALSRPAHAQGRTLFASHDFERWYLALVKGVPAEREGSISAHISDRYISGRRRIVSDPDRGRHAVTHYVVREAYAGAALLELSLETGRQHQIRLHLEQLGHPLLGERVYTDGVGRLRAPRQMLHAWRLRFPHPLRGHEIAVEAPVPADFAEIRAALARRRP